METSGRGANPSSLSPLSDPDRLLTKQIERIDFYEL